MNIQLIGSSCSYNSNFNFLQGIRLVVIFNDSFFGAIKFIWIAYSNCSVNNSTRKIDMWKFIDHQVDLDLEAHISICYSWLIDLYRKKITLKIYKFYIIFKGSVILYKIGPQVLFTSKININIKAWFPPMRYCPGISAINMKTFSSHCAIAAIAQCALRLQ